MIFFEAIFGFLIARCMWDFVQRRARACNESPLYWLVSTTGLLAIYTLMVVGPFAVMGLLLLHYYITRHQ
jgi:hypothetical protein